MTLHSQVRTLFERSCRGFADSPECEALQQLKNENSEVLLKTEQAAIEEAAAQQGLQAADTASESSSVASVSTASTSSEDGEEIEVGLSDFHLEKVLGKGSYGTVFKVTKKSSNKVYAMKTISKHTLSSSANALKVYVRERNMLLAIPPHPLCVGLHYSFTTKDRFYLVMDFCAGGDLDRCLAAAPNGTFEYERVRFYTAELVIALEHLHSNGILYRDLKPENVLVDTSGHLRLADFGISRVLESLKEIEGLEETDEATTPEGGKPGHTPGKPKTPPGSKSRRPVAFTFCGSPAYLSPEMLAKRGHGPEVDYFALGALVHEMLVGLPPFYSDNLQTMLRDIQWRDPKIPAHVPGKARSLITGLLHKKPEKRLKGATLRGHVFFSDMDWNALERLEVEPPFIPVVAAEGGDHFFQKLVRGMFG